VTAVHIKTSTAEEVGDALSNPSTKAIAYFGHADAPKIEGQDAAQLRDNIFRSALEKYRALGLEEPEAREKARERADKPNLDYAYMFSCHSLDNTSLADYLLRSGGTYWGEKGRLFGLWWLEKYVRP